MAIEAKVHIEGDKAVITNFDQIKGRASNMSSAFKQIATKMMKSHDINFKTHGSHFGKMWPARKLVYSWEILHKSGALSRGFSSMSTSDSATVTNHVPYARYHQLGTSKLPVRGIIGLANDGSDINNAIRIIRQHLRLEEKNV